MALGNMGSKVLVLDGEMTSSGAKFRGLFCQFNAATSVFKNCRVCDGGSDNQLSGSRKFGKETSQWKKISSRLQ